MLMSTTYFEMQKQTVRWINEQTEDKATEYNVTCRIQAHRYALPKSFTFPVRLKSVITKRRRDRHKGGDEQ